MRLSVVGISVYSPPGISVGGGLAGERALPGAASLPRSALGHCAGLRDPQARRLSCQVPFYWFIPRAPPALTWETAFLVKFILKCLQVE